MKALNKTLLVCILALLAAALWGHFFAGYVGDKILQLTEAKLWLEGKRLYVTLIEINPPLLIWLYAVPVYLSQNFGRLYDYQYLVILGSLIICGMVAVCLKLIQHHPGFAHNKTRQTEFFLLLLFVFVICQNPVNFLHREYIFWMLTFPYLLRFTPSLAKTQLPAIIKVIIGIMAAVGFCLKPEYSIILVGIHGMYFLRERSVTILVSVENITIYLITVLYLLSVWLFAQEYITTIIPLLLLTYSANGNRLGGIEFLAVNLLFFGITLADFRLRYTSPYRQDIIYLLVLSGLFVFCALINNGWGYSWNLVTSIGLIIAGFVLWEHLYLQKEYAAKHLPVTPFVYGARACMTVFLCNAVIALIPFAEELKSCPPLQCAHGKQFIRDIYSVNDDRPVSSFGTISNNFIMWSYLNHDTAAKWETRFHCLWMLPKFFISDEAFTAKNKWILDYTGHAFAEDMRNNKPELMFVDDTVLLVAHKYVDLLAFLQSASPEFAGEWKHYAYAGKVEEISVKPHSQNHHGFFVYKRIH